MVTDSSLENMYLQQLYTMTVGNVEATVSMHEVGEACGLDKNQSGSLAENLMVEGLVELKTLAGGIAITEQGLSELGVTTATTGQHSTVEQLSREPIASREDEALVKKLIDEIKSAMSSQALNYDHLEQVVIDMKTLEVQLLSPHPKTAIIRAILQSMADLLMQSGLETLAQKLFSTTDL